MCVMQGSTYAGGLFLAMCHDFKILKMDARVCLSEINIGLPFGNGYSALAYQILDYATMKHMMYGEKVPAKLALRRNVVDALYQNSQELEAFMMDFAKDHAFRANNRKQIKAEKCHVYSDVIRVFEGQAMNPDATLKAIQVFSDILDRKRDAPHAKL